MIHRRTFTVFVSADDGKTILNTIVKYSEQKEEGGGLLDVVNESQKLDFRGKKEGVETSDGQERGKRMGEIEEMEKEGKSSTSPPEKR